MTISTESYYKYSLSAPLILPALIYLTSIILGDPGFESTNGILIDVAGFIVFSSVQGSAPYLIFLLVTFLLYKKKIVKNFGRYIWFAPLIFLPIFFIVSYVISITGIASRLEWLIDLFEGSFYLTDIITISPMVLFIAYGYVVAAFISCNFFSFFDIVFYKKPIEN